MLKLDERLMRQMLASLPYFVAVVDEELRFVWVNRLDSTLRPEDVLGVHMLEFVHDDHREVARTTVEAANQTGSPAYYEARAYGSGEMETWYGTRVVPLDPAEFGGRYTLLLSSDVTETHQARAALERSERHHRRILQDLTEFLVRYQPDGTRTFVNEAYARFFGGVPEDFVGTSFLPLVAPEHRDAARRKIAALASGRADVLTDEHLSRRHDGVLRWTEWVDRGIFDEKGEFVELQAVGRDVTELREAAEARQRLEAELFEAQKLDSIGQLAGGVAHDFNNLLMIMMSHLDLARMSAAPEVQVRLDNVVEAAERAADLTSQLLAFARRQPHNPRAIALKEVVHSAERLLRSALPAELTLTVDLGRHGEATVLADRGQLVQVVLNLCINARDALEGRGQIAVRLTDATLKGSEAVAIMVEDDGPGMSDVVAARVFEPFFTTKVAGKGTGLGLSVVHGVVQQHGGDITVDSEQGRGTRFTVVLPLLDAQGARRFSPLNSLPPGRAWNPELRVLVAEDEPRVREVVTLMLEQEGFRVHSVANGEEAVEALSRGGYDVAVFDVSMPRMTGPAALKAATEAGTAVPTVFVSGDAERVQVKGQVTVPKPFRVGQLTAAIEKALWKADR